MSVFRRSYKDPKTGAKRQCKTYNYDFEFHGSRYRGSTECTGKVRAVAFLNDLRERLERGLAGLPVEKPAMRVRTVSVALDDHERTYRINHAPASVALVRDRGKHLRRLLGREILASLDEVKMHEYRELRLKDGAGARTIDMEFSVLSKAFGSKWSVLWPRLQKLDKGSEVAKIVTPADETRILEAASKARSPYLYTYLMIAFKTGMRASEVGKLKWERFTIGDSAATSIVKVGKSKTRAGEYRSIPMDERLWSAMVAYRAAYKTRFGDPLPERFIFPHGRGGRGGGKLDHSRPSGTVKMDWMALKKSLGIDYRLHDMRHTLATDLAKAEVSDAKIRHLLGWVDQRVIRRYVHLGAEDCREDLMRAFAKRDQVSTSLDTRQGMNRVPAKSPAVGKRKRKTTAA